MSPARWQLLARPAPVDIAVPLLRAHLERGQILGGVDTKVDYADCITRAGTPQEQKSLALVKATNPLWRIDMWDGKRKTRVLFEHLGINYDLGMTDLEWERDLRHLPARWQPYPISSIGNGRIKDGDTILLTVSLGDPINNGFCHKMVAGVSVLPRN